METPVKRDVRRLKPEELEKFFVEHGDKPFRAKQVQEWLWKKSAKDFDQMTNLSLPTRDLLKAHFTMNPIRVDHMQRSEDGTIKNAVTLSDGSGRVFFCSANCRDKYRARPSAPSTDSGSPRATSSSARGEPVQGRTA